MSESFGRREFIKAVALTSGALLLPKNAHSFFSPFLKLDDYPDAPFIGRNCSMGMMNFRARPSANAQIVKQVYEDFLFPIYREVIGETPAGTFNSKWFETPHGYVYSPSVQIVKNEPNEPLTELPETGAIPSKGFWAEVTVPYVGLSFAIPPISPWYQDIAKHFPRMYYSQVLWIDDIRAGSDGTIQYRANELYGAYGDQVYADGRAFRRITEEDVAPIHPEVENKRLYCNLTYQTISCFENDQEVYFCRTSSGATYDNSGNTTESYATPTGNHRPWRKVISIHMAGAASGAGWDTPGVGWNVIFATGGAAIHSTFWHNAFGTPRSHGCLNCLPEDAKWIWRWVNPVVSLVPGDLTVTGDVGTLIEVKN